MKVQAFSFNKDIPNITYVTVLGSDPGSVTNTRTFTSASIGGPGFIVVGVMGADAGATSIYTATVTIGGISATQLVATGSKNTYSGLFGTIINAGTTANIVVTFNQNIDDIGIGIWRVTGLNSQVPITTGTATFSSRNSFTLSVTPTGANQIYIVQTSTNTSETQTYSPNVRNYTNNRTNQGNQSGGSTTLSQTTPYTLTVTTGSATTGEMGGVAILLR